MEWSDLYGRCAFRLPNLTATHQSFYTLHNACNTLRDRHAAGHAFLLLISQRLWPSIRLHPPESASHTAVTLELYALPAADRYLCDLLLDRMERVIRFKDT